VAVISALAKLRHDRHVVDVVHRIVGVPMRFFPALAACELAGALGLGAGLWWPPLGAAAALGLVLYFMGAVAGHLRVGDVRGIGPALFALCAALASLVGRTATM
jgi:hypothetical protein